MSTSSAAINYHEPFFEFLTLTCIHGEPTYDSLRTLLEGFKANAQVVYFSLGRWSSWTFGFSSNSMMMLIVVDVEIV
jgi:hypothetical protein